MSFKVKSQSFPQPNQIVLGHKPNQTVSVQRTVAPVAVPVTVINVILNLETDLFSCFRLNEKYV